jgi:nitroreductase
VLYRILNNVRFAPSGGNRRAVRIIVVRDQQTRDHLAELSVPGARRYVAQLGIGEPRISTVRAASTTLTQLCGIGALPAGKILDLGSRA